MFKRMLDGIKYFPTTYLWNFSSFPIKTVHLLNTTPPTSNIHNKMYLKQNAKSPPPAPGKHSCPVSLNLTSAGGTLPAWNHICPLVTSLFH